MLLLSSIVLKDSEYVVGLDDIKLLEGIFLEQPKAPALENDPVSNVEHQHYYCVLMSVRLWNFKDGFFF